LSKKETKKRHTKKQYPESVCASRKLSGALKSGSPSATAQTAQLVIMIVFILSYSSITCIHHLQPHTAQTVNRTIIIMIMFILCYQSSTVVRHLQRLIIIIVIIIINQLSLFTACNRADPAQLLQRRSCVHTESERERERERERETRIHRYLFLPPSPAAVTFPARGNGQRGLTFPRS